MSLDQPTRSVRQLQTDRTCKDRVGEKRRSSHDTNQINKLKICTIIYIQPSSRNDLLMIMSVSMTM